MSLSLPFTIALFSPLFHFPSFICQCQPTHFTPDTNEGLNISIQKFWQKDKCHIKNTSVASGSTLRAELECGLELSPLCIDSASLCEMNSKPDDPEFCSRLNITGARLCELLLTGGKLNFSSRRE